MLPNALRWNGGPGHYEVYYLTCTEPRRGVGVWIRYTMIAPQPGAGKPPSCALWLLTMDPRNGVVGRKATFSIDRLQAQRDRFALRIADAVLTDGAMRGGFDDVHWDLRWRPGRAYQHVHPLLRPLAGTRLVLAHADIAIDGALSVAGERLELAGARGAQAHLWGSKHADSWAWAHCSAFRSPEGEPVQDSFLDAVSVFVSRLGRQAGPNTPVVGRIDGEDFNSTSPLRVFFNDSSFALTGWRFEAVDGARRIIVEVDADRDQLAGVRYEDPDGEPAYCYNSETASMRLHLYERARQVGGWRHRTTLMAPRRAHFEYAQRTPVPDPELVLG